MLTGVYFILDKPPVEGVVMILMAAITEALIFLCVKKSNNKNPWNFLFISYSGGAVLLSIMLYASLPSNTPSELVGVALSINAIIGLVGYYLRFYAIMHQSTVVYAAMSYVGVVMSYVYGWYFMDEGINRYEFLGTLFIIISSFWMQTR